MKKGARTIEKENTAELVSAKAEGIVWDIWDNLPSQDRIAINRKIDRVIREIRSRYTCQINITRESILLAYVYSKYYEEHRESPVATGMRTLGWSRALNY